MQAPAMANDHGHGSEKIARRLSGNQPAGHLKDVIYRGVDGAVTTFAIVAWVEGAGLPHGIIVALGLANIIADGLSMAAINYARPHAKGYHPDGKTPYRSAPGR